MTFWHSLVYWTLTKLFKFWVLLAESLPHWWRLLSIASRFAALEGVWEDLITLRKIFKLDMGLREMYFIVWKTFYRVCASLIKIALALIAFWHALTDFFKFYLSTGVVLQEQMFSLSWDLFDLIKVYLVDVIHFFVFFSCFSIRKAIF